MPMVSNRHLLFGSNFRRVELPTARCSSECGFTLVEVVVAIVILLGGALVVVGFFNLSTSSLFKSRNFDAAHAAIESDQSKIRRMAEEYSCCAGTCSTTGVCENGEVGDSYYYFPNANTDDDARNAFFAKCDGTSERLSQGLKNEIDGMSTTSLDDVNVSREVDFYSGTSSDHRLSIKYTSADGSAVPIDRLLIVQPTVSAWCR